TRYPISLARTVMEHSPHVMLQGTGADQFSRENGLEQVDPSWFFTPWRWVALEQELTKQGLPLPPRPTGTEHLLPPRADITAKADGGHGTVGCVARAARGNVAAATSTGGTTAKRWGRVGDSPIIGAGTYASNKSCAVSATGTGEYFIRVGVAHE